MATLCRSLLTLLIPYLNLLYSVRTVRTFRTASATKTLTYGLLYSYSALTYSILSVLSRTVRTASAMVPLFATTSSIPSALSILYQLPLFTACSLS
jgi:hypothetical protein